MLLFVNGFRAVEFSSLRVYEFSFCFCFEFPRCRVVDISIFLVSELLFLGVFELLSFCMLLLLLIFS